MFKLWISQILDFDQFDEQHCYCTCFRQMFEVNHLRRKYNKRSAAPPMPSTVLKSGIKSYFDKVVFQEAVIMLHLCCIFASQRICCKIVKTS